MGRRRAPSANSSTLLLVSLIIFFFFIGVLLIYLATPSPEIHVKMFENEPLGWTGVLILFALFIAIIYAVKNKVKL